MHTYYIYIYIYNIYNYIYIYLHTYHIYIYNAAYAACAAYAEFAARQSGHTHQLYIKNHQDMSRWWIPQSRPNHNEFSAFVVFQIHHYRHQSHHPPCASAKCLTSAHSSARFGWITRSWHVREDGQGLQGMRSERFPHVALHEHRPRCSCESDASAWRHTQGLWRTCCRPDIGTSDREPSGSSHLQPWMSGSIVSENTALLTQMPFNRLRIHIWSRKSTPRLPKSSCYMALAIQETLWKRSKTLGSWWCNTTGRPTISLSIACCKKSWIRFSCPTPHTDGPLSPDADGVSRRAAAPQQSRKVHSSCKR